MIERWLIFAPMARPNFTASSRRAAVHHRRITPGGARSAMDATIVRLRAKRGAAAAEIFDCVVSWTVRLNDATSPLSHDGARFAI